MNSYNLDLVLRVRLDIKSVLYLKIHQAVASRPIFPDRVSYSLYGSSLGATVPPAMDSDHYCQMYNLMPALVRIPYYPLCHHGEQGKPRH